MKHVEDHVSARAAAIIADSTIVGFARAATVAVSAAAASSRAGGWIVRVAGSIRVASGARRRVLVVAAAAAGVHIAIAAALPDAVAPTVPITAGLRAHRSSRSS